LYEVVEPEGDRRQVLTGTSPAIFSRILA
jgi:hypothetical protein